MVVCVCVCVDGLLFRRKAITVKLIGTSVALLHSRTSSSMFLPHSWNNYGTTFIPGDRWPKRTANILPPCLLETALRATHNQINHPKVQCVGHTEAWCNAPECLRPHVASCLLSEASFHLFAPTSQQERYNRRVGHYLNLVLFTHCRWFKLKNLKFVKCLGKCI